jgi:hypothetical protein
VFCLVKVVAAFLSDMEVGVGFGFDRCGGGGVLTEEVFWLRFFLGLGCCPGVPERARYVDTPC